MSNKTNLRPGDRVNVVLANGRSCRALYGESVYEVRSVDGYRCTISEVLHDGRLASPQPWDTDLCSSPLEVRA